MKQAGPIIFVLVICAGGFFGHQLWTSQQASESSKVAKESDTSQASGNDGTALDSQSDQGLDNGARIEDQLQTILKIAEGKAPKSELNSALQSIDDAFARLRDESSEKAAFDRLSALFVASHVEEKYASRFQSECLAFQGEYPNSARIPQVSTLRYSLSHDLKKPLNEQALTDLQAESSTHKNTHQTAAFYSAVATQLNQNRQKPSAEAVIEMGLKQLQGQPGHRQLFDLLFAQGHRKTPESQLAFRGKFRGFSPHRPKDNKKSSRHEDQLKELRKALDKMRNNQK